MGTLRYTGATITEQGMDSGLLAHRRMVTWLGRVPV